MSKTKNSPPSFAHCNTHWIKWVFPHENIAPTRVPYEINLFQFKSSLIWATKKEKHVGQNTGFYDYENFSWLHTVWFSFQHIKLFIHMYIKFRFLYKVKNDSCFCGEKLATVRNIMKNFIPSFWLNWIARFCVITSVCNSFGSAMHGFRLVIYLLCYKLTVSWKINANKLKQTKQIKKNTCMCVFLSGNKSINAHLISFVCFFWIESHV